MIGNSMLTISDIVTQRVVLSKFPAPTAEDTGSKGWRRHEGEGERGGGVLRGTSTMIIAITIDATQTRTDHKQAIDVTLHISYKIRIRRLSVTRKVFATRLFCRYNYVTGYNVTMKLPSQKHYADNKSEKQEAIENVYRRSRTTTDRPYRCSRTTAWGLYQRSRTTRCLYVMLWCSRTTMFTGVLVRFWRVANRCRMVAARRRKFSPLTTNSVITS
ncbi:hypothetical protein O3G_MSEX008586 [Manduca sexta]|uniref:Uncharacterized protein n=1 Tax=Manduca sexta TaxID=7130 RepID=A0A921ZB48_MANSE|nr:hypothetical protein O3G_MSEX008586 [Manduca sexta]